MPDPLQGLGRLSEPTTYVPVSLSDGPRYGYAIMGDVGALSLAVVTAPPIPDTTSDRYHARDSATSPMVNTMTTPSDPNRPKCLARRALPPGRDRPIVKY